MVGTTDVLQPIAPAPSQPKPQTAAEAAYEAVRGWLQATEEEATAIAESLQAHAEALRLAMQPREGLPVEQAAWREARRNYADVAELRTALRTMDRGKTGQSMGLEQLSELEDHVLEPWLRITDKGHVLRGRGGG